MRDVVVRLNGWDGVEHYDISVSINERMMLRQLHPESVLWFLYEKARNAATRSNVHTEHLSLPIPL